MTDKEKFLKRAAELALQSGCIRGKRGAVIVKDGQIVSEAFNMVYPTNDFCQKNGCLRDKLKLGLGQNAEICRSIHAEIHAITIAAKEGKSVAGAIAFITCMPCMNCAKFVFASGIKEVYFLDNHADLTGMKFLHNMGVKCERVELKGDKPEERLRDTTGQ